MYLFNIKQTDKGIVLVGRADNEAVVQHFVKSLEGSDGVFNAPEVTTVLPARFSSKDKLKAHITEMMAELGIDSVNIDTLSSITEDQKTVKPVLFTLRCAYTRPGQAPAVPGGVKAPVASLIQK